MHLLNIKLNTLLQTTLGCDMYLDLLNIAANTQKLCTHNTLMHLSSVQNYLI